MNEAKRKKKEKKEKLLVTSGGLGCTIITNVLQSEQQMAFSVFVKSEGISCTKSGEKYFLVNLLQLKIAF